MLSEAEARAARVEKAETLAKLCLEEARVEAEQKLIFCSERGSSVAASGRSRASRKSLRDLTGSVTWASKAKLGLDNGFSKASKNPLKLRGASASATRSQTIKTSLTAKFPLRMLVTIVPDHGYMTLQNVLFKQLIPFLNCLLKQIYLYLTRYLWITLLQLCIITLNVREEMNT